MKWLTAFVSGLLLAPSALAADRKELRVPILVYHRFDPATSGLTTITTRDFESHLSYLAENGYRVIRLREVVEFLLGHASAPPPRSVVITVDDGHESVYTELFPIVKKARIPITLFIYPSAISHASYALTWGQLRELTASGLFDVQSHTYWHPNFKIERRRLDPRKYQEFVGFQLTQSKATLERMLGCRVDLLAWPFGIYDDQLIQMAAHSRLPRSLHHRAPPSSRIGFRHGPSSILDRGFHGQEGVRAYVAECRKTMMLRSSFLLAMAGLARGAATRPTAFSPKALYLSSFGLGARSIREPVICLLQQT